MAARERFPGNRVNYLMEAMGEFAGDPKRRAAVRAFVEPLAESEIAAVASKAKRVLRKLK